MKKGFVIFWCGIAAIAATCTYAAYSPTYNQVERLITAVNTGGSGSGGGGTVIVGGMAVDDRTLTTNFNHGAIYYGKAGLYGARTAAVGSVPSKANDGSLVWTTAVGGSTLLIEGDDGAGHVTSATCTNRLRFVSSPESNVRFTVTPSSDGGVTVSVGVYYR